MPRYLITLSLGPVQSLIEAARRTRDLWCGSWLLSESARAAALALHQQQPGCLIFPCPDDPDTELLPQTRPGDDANIANILRAEVSVADQQAATALCTAANQAAASRLAELGEQARQRIDKHGTPLRADIWANQINDLLEGFSAWSHISADRNGYHQASARLGGLLAARKSTRDFAAAPIPPTPGLPKSSLDGGAETVLPHWPENHPARRKLGLSKGEQLDALGVAKRLAGDAEQFTAYARIAADPWLATLSADQLQRLRDAYEPLVKLQLATRTRGNSSAYQDLPYDAQLLYDFRLDNVLNTAPRGSDEEQALRALRRELANTAHQRDANGANVGAPVPYAAILKADGDRMGELLSKADSADRSRDISRALHNFASRVRCIVREHRGHAIYAGGDDVLAMLPLNHAAPCARALATAFADTLNPVAKALDIKENDRPTLSAGIGIGHLMEPLGSLRARADAAEKRAKGNGLSDTRNALAITLGIRSGGEYHWRAQWKDNAAFDALRQFTDAYRDQQLPSRIAYDLRGIDLRLAWLRDQHDEAASGMRQAEVARLLDRARIEGGERQIPSAERSAILQRANQQPLAQLADTLLIARWLSARSSADLGDQQ